MGHALAVANGRIRFLSGQQAHATKWEKVSTSASSASTGNAAFWANEASTLGSAGGTALAPGLESAIAHYASLKPRVIKSVEQEASKLQGRNQSRTRQMKAKNGLNARRGDYYFCLILC